MKKQITCPGCGREKTKLVLRAETYSIVNCSSCKIAFTFPAPRLPDYENMDFQNNLRSDLVERLTFKEDLPYDWQMLIGKQVEIIVSELSENAEILEIGCGEGILLHELKKSKFKNLEGIEPSKTACQRGRKKNLNIRNRYFIAKDYNKKFDLVMMSHVLEHIEKPLDTLYEIRSILKPGGYLMLTQTNWKGLLPSIQKQKWYAWVPEHHFWHFTPKGLKILLYDLGFTSKSLTYSPLVQKHDLYYKLSKLWPRLQDQFIILFRLE